MIKATEHLRLMAAKFRQDIVEMAAVSGEGHVSSGLSCMDMLTTLYLGSDFRYSNDPKWEWRDRLWLSKGHGVLALYPILAEIGYIDREELMTFCQDRSRLGIHAEPGCPGIEAVFGSLGHGFNLAVGASLAAKMDGKGHTNVVLMGDGECYEGQIWEAAMFAAHHRLDNLVVMLDRNGMCVVDHTARIVDQNSLLDKWESFGWRAVIVNGHDFGQIRAALRSSLRFREGLPKIIICNTVKGKGVSFMENVPLWHGNAITDPVQLEQARKELREEARLR